MKITLRQEVPSDYEKVFQLIRSAFESEVHTDHKEQFLVQRLRKLTSFIPELSIVAETEAEIIGHILLTRITIADGISFFPSLALAPISVKPEFQNKGIGGKLILESHIKAEALGFKSIVVLGHEKYYPKFGYEPAKKYGIRLPFEVPDENAMVIRLTEKGLEGVSGMVAYSEAFYE